jgi:hypothetical protein
MFANGVQRLSGINHFYSPLVFIFLASSAHLDSNGKHEFTHQSFFQVVCWVPSKSRQWPKIFRHRSFSTRSQHKTLNWNQDRLILGIHQAPFLNTFIHVVFLALAINYTNQRYMDDRVILTTKNIVVNSLNTYIGKAMPKQKHIFLSTNSMEMGDD